MKSASDIKSAIERNIQAMRQEPKLGPVRNTTVARLVSGLFCEGSEGKFTVATDMPERMGGSNLGPSPGTLARMALGSCLAIGYGMWFARTGLAYDSIEVEVESANNLRGFLGVEDSVSPGFEKMQVRVQVASAAPRELIEQALDQADRHSPVLHLVANPIPVSRELRLTFPATPGQPPA